MFGESTYLWVAGEVYWGTVLPLIKEEGASSQTLVWDPETQTY